VDRTDVGSGDRREKEGKKQALEGPAGDSRRSSRVPVTRRNGLCVVQGSGGIFCSPRCGGARSPR